MIPASNLFNDKDPNQMIAGFPYPKRYCKYCERELSIHKVIHLVDNLEHYKAIMICLNPECGAYDEEAREAYVRVYYSSQLAYDRLELLMGIDPRKLDERLRKS